MNINIKQIKDALDLDSITVIQSTTIICFPKKQDDQFKKKFDEIKKAIKSNRVDLVIGEDIKPETIKVIEHKEE